MGVHRYLHASRWNWWTQTPSVDPIVTSFNTLSGTDIPAIKTLVSSLKSAGIWEKLTDIFPLAGSTATSQSINLKTPGTNSQVFMTPGSATFSNLGYASNSAGYGYCTTAPQVLSSFSVYVGVVSTSPAVANDVIGLSTGSPFAIATGIPGLCYSFSDGNTYSDLFNQVSARIIALTPAGTSCLSTRLAGGNHRVHSNGSLIATAVASAITLADLNFWSLGSNSGRTYTFLAFGTELSSAEAASLDQIVKTYRA